MKCLKNIYSKLENIHLLRKILPSDSYINEFNINEVENKDLYVVRRIDNDKIVKNGEVRKLREETFSSKDVPNMSMNILGAKYKLCHLKYIIKSPGCEKWAGGKITLLSVLLKRKCIRISANYSACAYKISSLHNRKVPYERSFSSMKDYKDANIKEENQAICAMQNTLFKDFKENKPYQFEAVIELKHVPTNFNYWHIELNVEGIGKLSNKKKWQKNIYDYIRRTFLMYGYEIIDEKSEKNIPLLSPQFYLKSNN